MSPTCVLINLFICIYLVTCVLASDESKVVVLSYGAVKGEKYWDGEFYEFYGVPYATAPKGRDRFQAPLPPEPWQGVIEASKKTTICEQCYITGDSDGDKLFDGVEDCLKMNLLVPQVASDTNLVPVVVYIHSGAFSSGSGNMANFQNVAQHDVITISFNYRLGALGFACLGNKEIPGNAALKDQVAALRWIKKNIKKFGGDPSKVTLAGFSVGATMAELLSLSKAATGLFNGIILDSGSALAPFAINRDPISTAKNVAISLGYNQTMTLEGLTEFYLTTNMSELAAKSVNYHLKNSTFGFAPCIENVLEGIEPIITESPLDTLKSGRKNDVAVLTGFADLEGLSRSIKFGTWREDMNEDFSKFLPADLLFDNDKAKDNFINEVKKYYFNNKPVKADALQKYVDYFSDSMFKYSIMKSAKLHAASNKKPVYLYEFSYTGKLNIEHSYMDRIKGASHRDQTAYILDFFGHTNNYKDLDTRERLTTMWTDFVKYEDPTVYESSIINVKWLPYTNSKRHYLEINKKLQVKKDIFEEGYKLWDQIYKKYYWTPTPPTFDEINETNKETDTSKVNISLKEKEKNSQKETIGKEYPKQTNILKDAPKEKYTLKDEKILKERNSPMETDTEKEKYVTISKETKTSKDTATKKDVLNEKITVEQKDSLNVKESTKQKQTLKETDKKIPNEKDDPREKKTSKVKDTNKVDDIKTNNLKEKKSEKVNNTPKEKIQKETVKEMNSLNEKGTPEPKDNFKEENSPKNKEHNNPKEKKE